MTALGWTVTEIDEHDLFDVAALTRHWRVAPPIHLTIAGLFRSEASATPLAESAPNARRPTTKDLSDDEVEQTARVMKGFAQAFGGGAPQNAQ